MIHSLQIQGYRSLADFSLKLAPLTVVQGANGVGKSNLYKALRLFGSLAEGTFPQTMAAEGGTQSCLYAGPTPGPPKRKEVSIDLKAVDFRWQLIFGLVPSSPDDPTLFKGDPDLKKESLSRGRERHSRKDWAGKIPHNESLVSFIRDHTSHSLLSVVREAILTWRFYDDFRHDAASPLRQPSPCAWAPILSENGDNLAAAIQTINESSNRETLSRLIQLAFPDHHLGVTANESGMTLRWTQPHLRRPVTGPELSDGTLQFIALCAALLSPKPPSLLVLNEPENSLNPSLYPALVELINFARNSSQLLVITHSDDLCQTLVEGLGATARRLALQEGATRFLEDLGPKRVWTFDD
ncbi:MAG: AAA family ATPase [Akkermansiaceae bacterium]|jgi:predicted ATPase